MILFLSAIVFVVHTTGPIEYINRIQRPASSRKEDSVSHYILHRSLAMT